MFFACKFENTKQKYRPPLYQRFPSNWMEQTDHKVLMEGGNDMKQGRVINKDIPAFQHRSQKHPICAQHVII
jgi:hypothetical protein